MEEWITNILGSLGYPGIALLMFLENVIPPIPSEVIMPLAGFETARGTMALPGVIAAGTIGSVVGQLPLYYLGKIAGTKRLKSWADRHGKWIGVSSDDITHATEWFEKKGMLAVFLCRLVPGVRSLISVPAGVSEMPLHRFLFISALGMGIWTTALAIAGAQLGEHYERVSEYLGPIGIVVVAAIILFFVVRAIRNRGR